MEIISKYKSARSSVYKLKLILNSINYEDKIDKIINFLYFTNKKSSILIAKTIKSAFYNAINNNKLDVNKIRIKSILINKGPCFKRIFPRAKGRFDYITKRTSHIIVILKNN